MSVSQPPLKGLAGVAVLDGVQLLNAGLRTARRAGGVSRGTQNTIWNAPRRIRRDPLLPPLGVVLRAANQDSNDCRWQSYLCFVPRSGKGGAVGDFELLPFIEPHPLSQPCRFRSAVKSASSPNGGAKNAPTSPERFSRCSRPRRRTAVSCRAELPPQRLRGAVSGYVFAKTWANSYRPPLASPGGKLARPVRGVTEEGWRQPKYCLHFVQWYQSRLLPLISHCSDSFTTWRTALIKQAPFSTHRTLHETFGARHPSSVTPRWGAPAIESGYDCHWQSLF